MRTSRQGRLVVGQSGGPTPVINNTLVGVIEEAKAQAGVTGVLGSLRGISGVLQEQLLNLSAQPVEEIALLSSTPAAGAIGTCRYKLKAHQEEDFERIVEVFAPHAILDPETLAMVDTFGEDHQSGTHDIDFDATGQTRVLAQYNAIQDQVDSSPVGAVDPGADGHQGQGGGPVPAVRNPVGVIAVG